MGLNLRGAYISSADQIATNTLTVNKLKSSNQGDIIYDNGTNIVRLTPGTSGQFLKTQGAAANPVWADAIGTVAFASGGSAGTAVTAGTTTYMAPLNVPGGVNATEGSVDNMTLGVNGTIVKYWSYVSTAGGSAANTITLRLNATTDVGAGCVYTAGQTGYKEVTGLSQALVDTDTVSISIAVTGTGTSTTSGFGVLVSLTGTT